MLSFVKFRVKHINFDRRSKCSAAILDFRISQGSVVTVKSAKVSWKTLP